MPDGGGRTAASGLLTAAGDTSVVVPPADRAVTVSWVSLLPSSDNATANLLTVRFAGATPFYTTYVLSHRELFTGPPGAAVIINCANNQPVAYTIHYSLA